MELRDWLHFERRTVKEFAEMLDYSRPHLTGVISGNYKAGSKLIRLVEKATNGQVTKEDFDKVYSLALEKKNIK